MYTKPETEERRRLGRTYENKHTKYCFCSDNKLESLPENIFSNMPALHTVILSRNSFTVLHEGPWRPMLHQLSSINLEGNHLVCNRTIAWLVHHDMKGKVSGQCSEPRRLSNTPLSDLDESRLER